MQLDIRQIEDIIPHRYPFLLIDRVLECEPGVKLTALKNVTANEEFFNGHFPHQKVMPGVLMIEALAQAGCLYYYFTKKIQGKKMTFYLAKTEAKFLRPVVPGDQLRLEITPIKILSMAGFVTGKAYVGDQLVAEAEIGFSARENI